VFVLKKLLFKKKVVNIGKGELKITALFLYTLVLGVMGLVVYSRVDLAQNDISLEDFLICGISGRLDCTLPQSTKELSILSVSVTALLCFYPAVAFLVHLDPRSCKRTKTLGAKTQKTVRVTSNPV
jgi:hypothetical protein